MNTPDIKRAILDVIVDDYFFLFELLELTQLNKMSMPQRIQALGIALMEMHEKGLVEFAVQRDIASPRQKIESNEVMGLLTDVEQWSPSRKGGMKASVSATNQGVAEHERYYA